jgi:DNA-binding HxlR family transcriptional regulator
MESEQGCDTMTNVFALLGKRWSGLIMSTLIAGPARFSEIFRAVPGVSERMLSARLTELIAAGLVERQVLEGPPVGVQYQVTEKGAGLEPALTELERWGERCLMANQEAEQAAEAADG